MASNITLSAGVRQNLLSLQNTANLMAMTQNRLATGKKVNTALDNPTNFFTSASLRGRASDMSALLDAMSNGIKTLEAADNGLTAITKTVESMQSTLRQARQDKSFKSESYTVNIGTPAGTEDLSFTGGSVGTTAVNVNLVTSVNTLGGGAFSAVNFTNGGNNNGSISFDISANGGAAQTITVAYADVNGVAANNAAVTASELAGIINTKLTAANVAATAVVDSGGRIDLVSASADGNTANITVSNFAAANGATGSGLANGTGTDAYTAKTVDTLVAQINANTSLIGKVRASNDNGRLRIENLSTADLTLTGLNATTGEITGGTGTSVPWSAAMIRCSRAMSWAEARRLPSGGRRNAHRRDRPAVDGDVAISQDRASIVQRDHVDVFDQRAGHIDSPPHRGNNHGDTEQRRLIKPAACDTA